MGDKKFEIYFDCGSSKIRAGAFNKNNPKETFYFESKFFHDPSSMESNIKEIISLLEVSTKEYINDVNLMIDSLEMKSIGISISKKLDGSKLKEEYIQFLIQDAKQQILKYYGDQTIIHIMVMNNKIDNVEYATLPDDINCNLISLDILFVCISKETTEYFKKTFSKFDILLNKFICTSYAKSNNYKNNFSFADNLLFIDIGFNKTSIVHYYKNNVIFLEALPIGGNHITKDISKILKVNISEAEKLKLKFDKNQKLLDEKKISLELIQKIIFARIEEILELSTEFTNVNLNSTMLDGYKIVLMGDGSRILDNKFKEEISFSNDIDLLEETTEDICQSGIKLGEVPNKQEVVLIKKRNTKQGFFERLFHFFSPK
jgi:cell division protein FtsA